MKTTMEIDITQRVFALQHLDSGEFICLLQEGTDYLACFSDGDSALEFRSLLGLQEHVDLCPTTLDRSPFSHFWLDGESVNIAKESEVANLTLPCKALKVKSRLVPKWDRMAFLCLH